MGRFKDFIIRKLGGYTNKDLEFYIIQDRKSREVPRTIQFQLTRIGKSDIEKDDKCNEELHRIAFSHFMANSTIKKIYNPLGDYTNYFLIYDVPFDLLKEEIDYNAKEDK